MTLHKKWSFPLRISSVNVIKSAGNGRNLKSHLLKKSLMENVIFCAVWQSFSVILLTSHSQTVTGLLFFGKCISLAKVYSAYSFDERLIFFCLTVADISYLKFDFSQYQRNTERNYVLQRKRTMKTQQ